MALHHKQPFSMTIVFFFYCNGDPRDLHSFPTRRSSDLPPPGGGDYPFTGRLQQAQAIHAEQGQDFLLTMEFLNGAFSGEVDRKSTRLNSSHSSISYAVFCLKKKKQEQYRTTS